MKKFLKVLLTLVLILFGIILSSFFFIIISIIGIISYTQYKIDTDKPRIESKIEPNLDFVNSNFEYLYYKGDDLYIATIDGTMNKPISKTVSHTYYYDKNRERIIFISDTMDEITLNIMIYNLKNQKINNVLKINKQEYNDPLDTPQFSPYSTKLLYHIGNFVFIMDLNNNSNNLVFIKNKISDVMWDVNNSDIWIESYNENGRTPFIYFRCINPIKNKDNKCSRNTNKTTIEYPFGFYDKGGKNIEGTPFENINASKFVFKNDNRVLVNYNPGFSFESTYELQDFDYTKDLEYLLFTIYGKIYICKIKTGQIGYLTDGSYPRFVGNNSSINR